MERRITENNDPEITVVVCMGETFDLYYMRVSEYYSDEFYKLPHIILGGRCKKVDIQVESYILKE